MRVFWGHGSGPIPALRGGFLFPAWTKRYPHLRSEAAALCLSVSDRGLALDRTQYLQVIGVLCPVERVEPFFPHLKRSSLEKEAVQGL